MIWPKIAINETIKIDTRLKAKQLIIVSEAKTSGIIDFFKYIRYKEEGVSLCKLY